MTLENVIDEIKLELTGRILDLEIDDLTIAQVVKKTLRELNRYWDETTLITVPFASCIDLTDFNSSSIVKIYRTEGFGVAEGSEYSVMTDPMYMQQWMIFSNGGTMYNLNDYVLNYASYTTLQQLKNTLSTDLAFQEDVHNKKLYINCSVNRPQNITIEYIPKLTSVEDIKSDYWIDILIKMSLATTKVLLGRTRTRFTQSNALWGMDGETMLTEGTTELKELREILRVNSNLVYPQD